MDTFEDKRGWLCELYRSDSDDLKVSMGYISYTSFKVVRGPHEHKHQTDFFVFIGPGNLELYLWDNRKSSKTYGKNIKVIVGENNKVSVLIPPGVVHGYKSISNPGSISINLPDKLYKGEYKKENIDEIRYEDDLNSKFKIP